MKNTEIQQLTDKELIEKIESEKEQLMQLRIAHAVSPLENPMKIRQTRRNIARLKTELRKRQLKKIKNN